MENTIRIWNDGMDTDCIYADGEIMADDFVLGISHKRFEEFTMEMDCWNLNQIQDLISEFQKLNRVVRAFGYRRTYEHTFIGKNGRSMSIEYRYEIEV